MRKRGKKHTKTDLWCHSVFQAIFTNLGVEGKEGPKSMGSHYEGQDHDGQVKLSSGIQLWTVPYTGDYKIEAVGAAGGYYAYLTSAQYRGRGTIMTGTFKLNKGDVIKILVGQEGGNGQGHDGSGGGGGTFVVKEEGTLLIIAGGGGGVNVVNLRQKGCNANTSTTGNPGYNSQSRIRQSLSSTARHGVQSLDSTDSGKILINLVTSQFH